MESGKVERWRGGEAERRRRRGGEAGEVKRRWGDKGGGEASEA